MNKNVHLYENMLYAKSNAKSNAKSYDSIQELAEASGKENPNLIASQCNPFAVVGVCSYAC